MAKYFAVFLVPSFYFIILWVYSWESLSFLAFMEPISPSILFDVIIGVGGLYLLKQREILGTLTLKGSGIRVAFTGVIAIVCILLTNLLGLLSPFKYIEMPFVQLLIIAPFLEELVFRGLFFGLGEKAQLSSKVNVLYNSILFSISHAPAIWIISPEFHTFIIFQMFYTLGLGFICAQSRYKSQGLGEPILLHFIFNLVFYISVYMKYI